MNTNKFIEMEELYLSGTTQSLQWRQTQLQTLKTLISNNTSELLHALKQDLNKGPTEGLVTELNLVTKEIDLISQNLHSWLKPEQVPSPMVMVPCFSEVRYEPKGICLIIGSCNYPLNLVLLPTVGSLASGNPTVIKPSELCTETSNVLTKLVSRYFDKSILRVIEGGIPETSELLKQTWGIILFTGSERVGKIVACEAAKTLSPVILELGGKSPTYIDIDCPTDMRTVAMRIVWGKLMNLGQTCVAPDYVICHEVHFEEFCREVVLAIERMYTNNSEQSELPRMATHAHAKRQLSLLQEVESIIPSSSIIYGGSKYCNISQKYICPTVILNPPLTCKLLTEEIFGPILPIISIPSQSDAITFLQNKHKHNRTTPLALYIFTSSPKTFERFMHGVKSGGVVRNDVILQYANSNLPFGGLGTSGYGCYHGKYSLDAFSHRRAVLYKPAFRIFEFGDLRYHPYSKYTTAALILVSKLPDMPNLHTRKVFMLGIIFLVVAFGVKMLGIDVHNMTASYLRIVADYLDPTSI